MPGLEDKLNELDERMNRLENKLKLSLFEAEKLASQPKQESPEERILEMEDLILLMQLEITKIKDKISQEIDVELTPKTSQSAEDRLTRIEEEIGNIRSSNTGSYAEGREYRIQEKTSARVPEKHYREEFEEIQEHGRPSHEIERKSHAERQPTRKKREDEEDEILVRGSVLEDLQKILNK